MLSVESLSTKLTSRVGSGLTLTAEFTTPTINKVLVFTTTTHTTTTTTVTTAHITTH